MVKHVSGSGILLTKKWNSRQLHVAGLLAMIGGVILPSAIAVVDIIYPAIVNMAGTIPHTLYFVLWTFGALTLVIGTAGPHIYERKSYGRLGLVDAVVTGVGFALIAVATTLILLGSTWKPCEYSAPLDSSGHPSA